MGMILAKLDAIADQLLAKFGCCMVVCVTLDVEVCCYSVRVFFLVGS